MKIKMTKNLQLILIIAAAVLLVGVIVAVAIACSQQPSAPAVDDSKFTSVNNETVYAYYDANDDGICDDGAQINLRAEPKTDGELMLTLDRGTGLVRTGIYFDNGKDGAGWSRVEYNGKTYYTRNSCLSKIDPGPGPATEG